MKWAKKKGSGGVLFHMLVLLYLAVWWVASLEKEYVRPVKHIWNLWAVSLPITSSPCCLWSHPDHQNISTLYALYSRFVHLALVHFFCQIYLHICFWFLKSLTKDFLQSNLILFETLVPTYIWLHKNMIRFPLEWSKLPL